MPEEKKKFDKVAYNNSFIANAYDCIKLTVPKGEKDVIKSHAEKYDSGNVNGFIRRAIDETMARDQAERYLYPAVLTYEEGYEIAVTFPDLPGCATSGETEQDAVAAGREALGLHLFGMEEDGDDIPVPSRVKDIALEAGEVIAMIDVFMPSIRLSQRNKSINRTVTLPAWLNAKAMECGINFSQLLQDAIKKELGVPSDRENLAEARGKI